MRVKTGIVRRRRHKKILRMMEGQHASKHLLWRRANEAMLKSLWYAFRDRRVRRRDLRALWITRINAAARLNGVSYSRLIAALKKANIEINRKMLSQIAIHDPQAFTAVVQAAQVG
jgi:large subunit ribosomal protein L20